MIKRKFVHMKIIKFVKRNPDVNLLRILKSRVYDHFKEKNIPLTGTWRSYLPAGLMIFLFFVLLLLPYIRDASPRSHYVYAGILGAIIGFIGFMVGHTASHGSFSKNKEVNELLSYSFDLFSGVSSFFWKIKHEVVHHTYTNIYEFDDDIETGGVFRFSPLQKWYPWHLVQIVYMLPFYAFLHFQWIFIKDFQKLYQMKVGQTEIKKIGFADIFIILGGKIIHVLLFMVLPYVVFGFEEMLRAYVCMICTTGLIITIIFQLAHVQRKSIFLKPDQATGNIKNDWIIVQILSTANFGQDSYWVRLLTGGLSNQIEHHAFPDINPEHYPIVSEIMINFCKEFKLPYNRYDTIAEGFVDHSIHVIEMSFKPKQTVLNS